MSGPALTEHAELHGCSCKVGQSELESLLADAGLGGSDGDRLLGVGEDAAARRLRDDLALVETLDFFTPVVDDPYDFGRVAACNATSDAFAAGAAEGLSLLVVLALPRELTDCAADILAGMADALDGVGGSIAGGHTVLNPWPLAGGAVTASANPDSLLSSGGAEPGDTLYLTKPLGTQSAMGAERVAESEFGERVRATVGRPVETVAADALAWMTTPNRDAALAVRDGANAATDITGFGLLGQSGTLAERSGVGVEVTSLPVIAGTPDLSALFGYGLDAGEESETSGGLLVSVPEAERERIEANLAEHGVFYREVGRVVEGEGARLVDPAIEEVAR